MNNYVAPVISQVKGIAMVQPQYDIDLTNSGSTWYYTWTPYPQVYIDPRHIPMSRCGLFDTSIFPTDYTGYVLIFNEPVNKEPNGCGITPQLAAERYMTFMDTYPNVIPVVGNNGVNGAPWNMDFIDALKAADYPLPSVWGLHLYYESWYVTYFDFDHWVNNFVVLDSFITQSLGFQPEYWITEFAMATGDPIIFEQMLDYIGTQDSITHVAPFTNRAMYNEPWWPSGWVVELYNDNGTLTPMGQVYKEWYP